MALDLAQAELEDVKGPLTPARGGGKDKDKTKKGLSSLFKKKELATIHELEEKLARSERLVRQLRATVVTTLHLSRKDVGRVRSPIDPHRRPSSLPWSR